MPPPVRKAVIVRALINISEQPEALPVRADDIVEFHAARLVLLFWICGNDGRIEGLTKMAKLDFFVRYPQFFIKAAASLHKDVSIPYTTVESSMVRFHYGPWDQRYYHVLAYLESRQIVEVTKQHKTYSIALTNLGKRIAEQLSNEISFSQLTDLMTQVNKVLGSKNGTQLKKLVYQLFDKEVAQLQLNEVI